MSFQLDFRFSQVLPAKQITDGAWKFCLLIQVSEVYSTNPSSALAGHLLSNTYYSITMTSFWARWRLKSLALWLSISIVCSCAVQRKHQSSPSLTFVSIHQRQVNSPHRVSNTENVFIWCRLHAEPVSIQTLAAYFFLRNHILMFMLIEAMLKYISWMAWKPTGNQ